MKCKGYRGQQCFCSYGYSKWPFSVTIQPIMLLYSLLFNIFQGYKQDNFESMTEW